jgi:hypothetical protein
MPARPQPEPTVPLVDLACQRRLPPHQVMDQPTLSWITRNRPVETVRLIAVPDPPEPLVPEVAWFAREQAADGIHGVRHNARVCLLAALLAQQSGLDAEQSAALRLAGAVHDCRRHNDRADPGHGQRAAHWLTRHHPAVTASFGMRLPEEAVTAACTAIGLHDVDCPDFSSTQRDAYAQASHLTDLLKAATASTATGCPPPAGGPTWPACG